MYRDSALVEELHVKYSALLGRVPHEHPSVYDVCSLYYELSLLKYNPRDHLDVIRQFVVVTQEAIRDMDQTP